MKPNEHHPSCRPNDRNLVWHCSQCGLNEPADDYEGWKESAEKVFSDLNLQEIGKELELPLGSNIAKEILPWIRRVNNRNATHRLWALTDEYFEKVYGKRPA